MNADVSFLLNESPAESGEHSTRQVFLREDEDQLALSGVA